MSSGVVTSGAGYYTSGRPQTPSDVRASSSHGSPGSSLILDENEQVSELAFARWKVEMANRLIVAQEKKAAEERKEFKATQVWLPRARPNQSMRGEDLCLQTSASGKLTGVRPCIGSFHGAWAPVVHAP